MEYSIESVNEFRSELTGALDRGETDAVLSRAAEAAALCAVNGDSGGEATARYLLGLARSRMEDIPAAIAAFRASAWLWESVGDKRGLADALSAWAIALFQRAGHLEALPLIERSAALYEELGDEPGQARTFVNISAVYQAIGDIAASREVLHRALALYEIAGDPIEVGSVLLDIAGASNVLENRADAIRFGTRALAVFQAAGDSGKVAAAHLILGNTCLRASDLEDALDHFQAALDSLPEGDNASLRAAALEAIGDVLVRQGRCDEALSVLERSLSANQDIADPAIRGGALERLATLHADFEDQDDARALSLLLEARELIESTGTIAQLPAIYSRLTDIYERRGDFRKALTCHRRLLETQKRLFDEESDRRIKVLEVRFQVEKARKDAEIAHLRSVELASALAETERLRALADEQARTDALTGVYNRRHFDERFAAEFERSARYTHPLSLAILDIDHFKRINDSFGHAVGDATLCRLAALLRDTSRADDTVARFGGEEFALLMPETELAHAEIRCQRLRVTIENIDWEAVAPGLGRVTASIGISTVSGVLAGKGADAGALLEAADRNLYAAKANGRNCVVSAVAGAALTPGLAYFG